jgi:hypothetical protein
MTQSMVVNPIQHRAGKARERRRKVARFRRLKRSGACIEKVTVRVLLDLAVCMSDLFIKSLERCRSPFPRAAEVFPSLSANKSLRSPLRLPDWMKRRPRRHGWSFLRQAWAQGRSIADLSLPSCSRTTRLEARGSRFEAPLAAASRDARPPRRRRLYWLHEA